MVAQHGVIPWEMRKFAVAPDKEGSMHDLKAAVHFGTRGDWWIAFAYCLVVLSKTL